MDETETHSVTHGYGWRSDGVRSTAIAQDYPSRPIEVIVGFPPGSAVDTNIRTILPTLQKILNVPIVVDNRPGAGGAIGFNSVAKAKPDGYTLGSINYPAIAGIYATGGMAFDPLEKFTVLGNMIYEANVVSVAKDSPYKSLSEMVAYLKEHHSKRCTSGNASEPSAVRSLAEWATRQRREQGQKSMWQCLSCFSPLALCGLARSGTPSARPSGRRSQAPPPDAGPLVSSSRCSAAAPVAPAKPRAKAFLGGTGSPWRDSRIDGMAFRDRCLPGKPPLHARALAGGAGRAFLGDAQIVDDVADTAHGSGNRLGAITVSWLSTSPGQGCLARADLDLYLPAIEPAIAHQAFIDRFGQLLVLTILASGQAFLCHFGFLLDHSSPTDT